MVKKDVKFMFAENYSEVIKVALVKTPK
jgi:hypothetical protein